jgi:hypothetical protein
MIFHKGKFKAYILTLQTGFSSLDIKDLVYLLSTISKNGTVCRASSLSLFLNVL